MSGAVPHWGGTIRVACWQARAPGRFAGAGGGFTSAQRAERSCRRLAAAALRIVHDLVSRFGRGGARITRVGRCSERCAHRHATQPSPACDVILHSDSNLCTPGFADLWLAETLASTAQARDASSAVHAGPPGAADKPLWLSFSLKSAGGDAPPQLLSGESVADAAAVALSLGAGALLFNCAAPELMRPAIAEAVDALGGNNSQVRIRQNLFPLINK